MTKPKTEREMVKAASSYLRKKNIVFADEVPLLNRSIDLVYEVDGVLTAVEFKVSDWQRALIQAQDHSLGADEVFVCIPSDRVTVKLKERAASLGIGILGWSWEDPLRIIVDCDCQEIQMQGVRDWLVEGFRLRLNKQSGESHG